MTDVLTVGVDPARFETSTGALGFTNDAELRRRLGVLERNAGRIGVGAIQGGAVIDGQETRNHILALSVTSAALYAGTIDADLIQGAHIAANTLGAGHIDVATLDALAIDAGIIFSGVFQGTTFRTDDIPARVQLDPSGLWASDGTNETFRLAADGDLTLLGGIITGATIQSTAADDAARFELDAAGLRFYPAGVGADPTINLDATTGIASVAAVIEALPGSSISMDYFVGQIDETQIEDAAITTPKLAANSVQAHHIQSIGLAALRAVVGSLSVLSADAGTISAGIISGVSISGATITGGMLQTAETGARVVITSNGIVVRKGDLATDITVSLPADPASSPYFAGRIIADAGLQQNTATTYPADAGSKLRWVAADSSERAAIAGTRSGYPNKASGHNISGLGVGQSPTTQAALGALRAYATESLSYNAVVMLDAPWGYWRLGYPGFTDTSGAARAAFSRGPYSSGPHSPTAAVNEGGGVAWTNPTRVFSSDDLRSEGVSGTGLPTRYLKATDFGLSLPEGAKIEGITVEVERSKTAGGGGVQDWSVKIVKGGTIAGGERGSTDQWPTGDSYRTYGGSTDLWGESWTKADIENAGFGVAVSALPEFPEVARIDHIRITVHYTTGSMAAASSLVLGGDAATQLLVSSASGVARGAYATSPMNFSPAGNFSGELWVSASPASTGTEEFVIHSNSLRIGWAPAPTVRVWRVSALIGGTWRTIDSAWTPAPGDKVAVTYNGSTLRLYVNGISAGTVAATGTLAATGNVLLGHPSNVTSPIVVDEFALYTTALSADRVEDHRQTGLTGQSVTFQAKEIMVMDSAGRSNLAVEWAWNLANVGSFTIDNTKIPGGLDGNNDYGYELLFFGRVNGNGAGRSLGLRPNSDAGTYENSEHYHGWPITSPVSQHFAAGQFRLVNLFWGDISVVEFAVQVAAKAHGSGYSRAMRSEYSVARQSPNQSNRIGGQVVGGWLNGTQNITSLLVDFAGATCVEGVLILRRKRLSA